MPETMSLAFKSLSKKVRQVNLACLFFSEMYSFMSYMHQEKKFNLQPQHNCRVYEKS